MKILCVLFLLCLALCGCLANNSAVSGGVSQSSGNQTQTVTSKDISRLEYCDNVLRAFNDKDKNLLLDMFSSESKSLYDLDIEAENALNFFDGKIVSVDEDYKISSDDMQDWRDGKLVRANIEPTIEKIQTDKGRNYRIVFGAYLVYTQDTNKEGIMFIDIFDENNDVLSIGGCQ